MRKPDSKPDVRKDYQPPTLTRVHVDPQQELLQASGCSFHLGDGGACDTNPGT